jgi:hypothetical protein
VAATEDDDDDGNDATCIGAFAGLITAAHARRIVERPARAREERAR